MDSFSFFTLRKYCDEQKFPFVDLAIGIPQLGLQREEVDKYWDDSIHLNPAGYDRFGELIFEKLSEHIVETSLY